jgi:uncharacterized protein YbjT (DUF2867 family)
MSPGYHHGWNRSWTLFGFDGSIETEIQGVDVNAIREFDAEWTAEPRPGKQGTPMTAISIIGLGNMARALADRALAGGHTVEIIGRDRVKAKELATTLGDVSVGAAGALGHRRTVHGAGIGERRPAKIGADEPFRQAHEFLSRHHRARLSISPTPISHAAGRQL